MSEFNLTYQSAHGTAPDAKAVEAVGVESGYSLYNGLKLPTLDPAYNWMIFGGAGLTEVTQVTVYTTESDLTYDMLYFAVPTTSPSFSVAGNSLHIDDGAILAGALRVFDQDGNDVTETVGLNAEGVISITINGLLAGVITIILSPSKIAFANNGFPPLYWTNDSALQVQYIRAINKYSCWGTSKTSSGSGSGSSGGSGGSGSTAYYTSYVCEITDPETVYDGYEYLLTEADLPTLSADGCLFGGWSVDGVIVSAGYEISADTVLTAVWVEDSTVSKIDPASFLQGYLAGCRLRANR